MESYKAEEVKASAALVDTIRIMEELKVGPSLLFVPMALL